uniref:uncharacterized protein LOC125906738 n=1 Tax=Anopheles coluzzii TaxID=1518534 RepID=UPI0020FFAB13|nr:uncharacterized protein LOC125906738 [Anopheles coluzzii]
MMGPPAPPRDFFPMENRNPLMPIWMDRTGKSGILKYLVMSLVEAKTFPNNPFLIGKSIENMIGNFLPAIKIENGSKVLIKTRSAKQFEKIQKMTQLIDGTKVSIVPHATMNSVQCVIYAPELSGMPDSDIMEELKEQNVVEVRRFTRKTNQMITPTNSFLLTIGAPKIPEFIRLGAFQVRTRYGYTKTRCNTNQLCKNCGEPEHGEYNKQAKCPNCTGTHNAYDKSCPVYMKEEEIIKYRVDNNLTHKEARMACQTTSSVQNRLNFAQACANNNSDDKDIIIENLSRTIAELTNELNKWKKCQKN